MVFGAQLYTVRDFTKTEKDIEETFKRIAEIGYKTAQVSAIGQIAAERLREIADRNQLELVITHTNYDRIINDTKAVIKEHNKDKLEQIQSNVLSGKCFQELLDDFFSYNKNRLLHMEKSVLIPSIKNMIFSESSSISLFEISLCSTPKFNISKMISLEL
jgi:hypothetical protein